jgi:predicted MFS family arabinose efflux permease
MHHRAYDRHADYVLVPLSSRRLAGGKNIAPLRFAGSVNLNAHANGGNMDRVNSAGNFTATDELRDGWWLILTSALGCALGYGALVFYTFGLFIDPIGQEFGWTRGQVSSIFSYGSVSILLTGPLMGWVVDRVGYRLVALTCIPVFSALLFTLSQMSGSFLGFVVAFATTGLIGLGTTPVIYTRIVNENFSAARGLALGLTLVGVGATAILLPPAISKIIAENGWRSAFSLMSALAIVPWAFVFLITNRSSIKSPASNHLFSSEVYWSALKSPLLWRLGIGFAVISLAVSALIVHIVPMLRDLGMTQANAVGTASLMGFGVIFGRLIVGWLLDRVFAPYLVSALLLIGAAGVICFAQVGALFAPVAALLMGFVLGAEVDLIAYLTARYFGMKNYSFLFAVLYTCFALGAGNGPTLLGQLYDRTGSYHLALWAVAILLTVAAIIFGTFPSYSVEQATVPETA